MLIFELEEQTVLTAVHQNRSDEIEEVHARCMKTLQDAGIYTCNRMKANKNVYSNLHTVSSLHRFSLEIVSIFQSFTEIRGLSEAKAVYWPIQFVISSTKSAFNRPYHIVPIAERFVIDAEAVLDNIFYAFAYTYEHQYNLLLGLATKKSQEPFRLLVVDSVIALFRVDFTGRELAENQQKLSQMMSLLMKIPKEFNIAVYMTNSGRVHWCSKALEIVSEVIADPGKVVFNGADARNGRQVSAGTIGGTSGIDGGGAGPGGGAGTGGVAGTDGGVAGPGGGGADGAGTGGGVGAGGDGGDGGGEGGGGNDDDGGGAAAAAADDDDDEEEEEEEEEEGAAALLDNIPPNQDVLARIGGMRLYVKEFEAMVKGDEFQTEVLKFAADRNLLPHLLEGQKLDNIPNLRKHFLERSDFIKEALNIVETNIEFSDEEMELPTDEDFLVAQEIMVFAQAKRHVTDRAP